MKVVYGTFLVMAIALSPPPLLAAVGPGHDFTGQCFLCHQADREPEAATVMGAVDPLCRQCHVFPGEHNHPSQVVPPRPLPETFWLDAEGRLNCATCHDPHPAGNERFPHLLRVDGTDAGFCLLCHAEQVTGGGEHVAVALVAHGTSGTPSLGSDGEPDPVSRDCIACHDGTRGPHASYCLHLQKERGGCGGHIIGLNYREAAAGNKELVDRGSLSPNIILYEGKVGCASCHSIYSDLPRMVTVPMGGSALCLECHRV